MKTIYSVLLSVLIFQHTFAAQQPAGTSAAKGQFIAALNLNAEQQKQLMALRKETKAAKQQNAISFANDKKALHEANKQLRLSSEAKMKTILTPDQWTKWQAMKEQKQQEKKQARLNQMASYLGLTEDQKKAFADLTTNHHMKLKENRTLYASQPDALKNANRQTNQSYRAELTKILSPAQIEKLKSWRKEHKKQ